MRYVALLISIVLFVSLCLAGALVDLPLEWLHGLANKPGRAPQYGSAQELPSIGGNWSAALDISENGQIAGVAGTAEGRAYAVRWSLEHGAQNLGAERGIGSLAHGINDQGQVIGEIVAVSGPPWPLSWHPDTGLSVLSDLGGDSGIAYDINDAGQIVGVTKTGHHALHACLWTADHEIVDLGTLGGANSIALALNDAGHVVGKSQVGDGSWHMLLWTPETGLRDLGAIGESPDPTDINDQGVIAGRSLFHHNLRAWCWSESRGVVILPDLGGRRSSANGINNLGQVVGFAEDEQGVEHAVLWDAKGQIHRISQPDEAGAVALAINDHGIVAGRIPTSGDDTTAVIWAPIVE